MDLQTARTKRAHAPVGDPEGPLDRGDELKENDRFPREIESLRGRLSRLSRASLRITEDLDLGVALQEIADEARSLTGTRYAVIATLGESGDAEDFTASGLSARDAQRLWEIPGGLQFFEYLSALPEPLRVADFAGHARAMGLPEFLPPMPMSSLLAAPVRHRGASVGHVYVAKSAPREEFSREDEETLVMFASQAALVISNARRLRDERRARADLETLIDTSPVGVVVFDAKTGTPASFNREARRLADGLLGPGESPEDVLETLTVRMGERASGAAKLPLARLVRRRRGGAGAGDRALLAPGGGSRVRLAIATPIPSDAGRGGVLCGHPAGPDGTGGAGPDAG